MIDDLPMTLICLRAPRCLGCASFEIVSSNESDKGYVDEWDPDSKYVQPHGHLAYRRGIAPLCKQIVVNVLWPPKPPAPYFYSRFHGFAFNGLKCSGIWTCLRYIPQACFEPEKREQYLEAGGYSRPFDISDCHLLLATFVDAFRNSY